MGGRAGRSHGEVGEITSTGDSRAGSGGRRRGEAGHPLGPGAGGGCAPFTCGSGSSAISSLGGRRDWTDTTRASRGLNEEGAGEEGRGRGRQEGGEATGSFSRPFVRTPPGFRARTGPPKDRGPLGEGRSHSPTAPQSLEPWRPPKKGAPPHPHPEDLGAGLTSGAGLRWAGWGCAQGAKARAPPTRPRRDSAGAGGP